MFSVLMSQWTTFCLYERTSGAAGQPLGSYQRRASERTVLHEVVAHHAQSMLAELRDADPDLRCGILAHGFTRVRCQTCHDEIVVVFSCKRRGLCPSCTSRRMADRPRTWWIVSCPQPRTASGSLPCPGRCDSCSPAIPPGRDGPARSSFAPSRPGNVASRASAASPPVRGAAVTFVQRFGACAKRSPGSSWSR